MKIIVGLLVLWFALMGAYFVTQGNINIQLPSLPEPAPAPVVQAKTWEGELAAFCRDARSVRNATQSVELNAALSRSACASVIGIEDWKPTPVAAPVQPVVEQPAPQAAPVPVEAPAPVVVTTPQPEAQVPVQRLSIPAANPAPHMSDTCWRMREKLDDQTIPDTQWFPLRDTYIRLCQ